MFFDESDSESDIPLSQKIRKMKNFNRGKGKRKKKTKKHAHCSLLTDSDSSSSIEQIKYKKKIRVIQSESDSSDSDMIVSNRGFNKGNKIFDEDLESNSSSSWSVHEEMIVKKKSSRHKLKDSSIDDSSDDHSERCPICLVSFKDQLLGFPESCDHCFCASCIEEWSKSNNTCPVDRLVFESILIRKEIDGGVISRIKVERKNEDSFTTLSADDFNLACEVCQSDDNGETMLLCDGCNLGYHMVCLNPPLEEVPPGEWFCPTCTLIGLQPREQQEGESVEIGRNQNIFNLRRPINNLSIIPHTNRLRLTLMRMRRRVQAISPEIDAVHLSNNRSRVAYSFNKRKQKRKKSSRKMNKKEKKKKVYKKEKKRKNKVELRLSNQARRSSTVTLNQNIADSVNYQRNLVGIPRLHLFGQLNDLDYFSSSDSDNNNINESYNSSGGCLLLTSARPSTSFRRCLKSKSSVQTNTDVLGSIMENLSKFHSKQYTLSVTEGGNIKLNDKNANDVKKRNAPMLTESDSTSHSSSSNANLNRADGNEEGAGSSGNDSGMRSVIEGTTRNTGGNSAAGYSGDGDRISVDYSPFLHTEEEEKEEEKEEKKKSELYDPEEENSSKSTESELDIYGDIETVSTSKTEEDLVIMAPENAELLSLDDNDSESDSDLVIDDTKTGKSSADQEAYDPACIFESDEEKAEEGELAVSSTVDSTEENNLPKSETSTPQFSTCEIQSNTVQSSNLRENNRLDDDDDDDEEEEDEFEDDCPNFSIYSTESISMAKSTDLAMMEVREQTHPTKKAEVKVVEKEAKVSSGGLYSDSEDENLVKIDRSQPFGINDLQTEDISEDEERSYTPCLDEKEPQKQNGLEGLDTEMISDDDKNDFDDTNDPKTVSDGGEALEINAKESELDFTRPDDCEEGEIVDKKGKNKENETETKKIKETKKENETVITTGKKEKDKEKKEDGSGETTKGSSSAVFKRISKSNRERNYRENKTRSRSKSKEKKESNNKRRRREIALYNVRSMISEKPRRDKFGRDIRRVSDSDSESPSRSSRSLTPPVRLRSPEIPSISPRTYRNESSPRLLSRLTATKRTKSRSRSYHTPTKRRSRSLSRCRSRSYSPSKRGRSKDKKKRKRDRSPSSRSRRRSRSLSIRKKSRNRSQSIKKKKRKSRDRSKSRKRRSVTSRSASPPPRRRDWEKKSSRGWTPSLSPTSPVAAATYNRHHVSPSWTPPRLMNPSTTVKPQNLTVILTNDANKKTKKEKKKRAEKRSKDGMEKVAKKRKKDKSPGTASKEVFASGNNILVSVSFNKDAENSRDVQTMRKRYEPPPTELTTKRIRKDREKKTSGAKVNPTNSNINSNSTNNNNSNNNKSNKADKRLKMANVKPVAIIDLENSPFRELTSPQDVIVLTDSENGDTNEKEMMICDSSSQQISSPMPSSSAGPKTPPEPQVKFSLNSKQSQMRPIVNPLHDPEEEEEEEEEEEYGQETRRDVDNQTTIHKGPNTPPEPPNSPPSSPDAYDPFDPTKSRSASPEPPQILPQSNNNSSIPCILEEANGKENEKANVGGVGVGSGGGIANVTPPDVRAADSQSSLVQTIPEAKTSPEMSINVVINQVVQQNQSQQMQLFASSTPQQQSAGTNVAPLITSTPSSLITVSSRLNILNSTVLIPSSVSSSVINSQRTSNVGLTTNRTSPAGSKGTLTTVAPPSTTMMNLDFDSPYSPGSSDYEDLFEPPPDNVSAIVKGKTMTTTTSTSSAPPPSAASSVVKKTGFDQLFGSSPQYNKTKTKVPPQKPQTKTKPSPHNNNNNNNNNNKPSAKVKTLQTSSNSKGTKVVGVKMDEDNLKILDELPNSAVEMQVKDKFLKKLNRQERVVEEVKLVLKPHYNKKHVTKEEYKDILRRAVPKICHNKSGEINPKKIQALIEAYVRKIRHSKKVTSSSSSVNPQKTDVISNWLSKIN